MLKLICFTFKNIRSLDGYVSYVNLVYMMQNILIGMKNYCVFPQMKNKSLLEEVKQVKENDIFDEDNNDHSDEIIKDNHETLIPKISSLVDWFNINNPWELTHY